MAIEARETPNLIGSDKVEGTAVYDADGTKIGTIERVMIDKLSGKVSYAVLSFGSFLRIGDDHYPLPWQSLTYDINLGAYVSGITETQLKNALRYSNDNAWNWSDPARTRSERQAAHEASRKSALPLWRRRREVAPSRREMFTPSEPTSAPGD